MRFSEPQLINQKHIDVRRSIAIFCVLVFIFGNANFAYSQENVNQDLIDIQNSQFDDSYETLLVGESEMPIILKESTTPITRGVAILFTDFGSNPFSEHGIGQLATYLNDFGWVTITIQAPNEGFLQTELAEAVQKPSDDLAPIADLQTHAKQGLSLIDQEAFTRHETILKLQLQALQTRAAEYQGFFLIVAEGTSAAWLTKIFAEKQLVLPDALVSVSPYWPQHQYNQTLATMIAQTEMPYLDIYTNADNDWAASTVSNRKVQAVKSLKMMYRQRKLIGQSINSLQHSLLAKEIYGWLSYMGW